MKNFTFKALVSIFIIILVAGILTVFVLGNKTALAPVVQDDSGSTGISTPGTASTSTSSDDFDAPKTIFGQKVSGDLNKDGKSDNAYIYTQSPGGSGTFFYVTAELATSANVGATNATTQTNSILLGDRIAPQNINIVNGKIVVNYADRKATEPMTTRPSVGVTKYLVVENGKLVETPAPTVKPVTTKPAPTKPAPTTAGERCMANEGSWSAQYNECGGVSSATCKNIGGTFDECASPCRHDPNATVCVAMCAQVCYIK